MPAGILGMHVHMMHHMQDTHTFYLDVQLMMLPISLVYDCYTPSISSAASNVSYGEKQPAHAGHTQCMT